MENDIFSFLPKRKNNRLEAYRYSQVGAFFITICSHQRQNRFSRIVGAIHESPANQLTPYGHIIKNSIESIPSRFPNVSVDSYIIMPNHVHLVLSIKDYERAIHESPLRVRSTISKAIGFMKASASKSIHRQLREGSVWQRSYHDHIIRDRHEYRRIAAYVANNPLFWQKDCLYQENEG